jgi:hypothetical protein
MVEDVVVGFEDAVREPIVAHELPDVLDRIELGRFRRQQQERDVVWDGKPLRDMPSRLIKNRGSRRMCIARSDRVRESRRTATISHRPVSGPFRPSARRLAT